MVLVGQHLGNKRLTSRKKPHGAASRSPPMYIMTVGVTFLLIPGFYLSWFKNQDNAALWETVSMTVPYL